VVNQKEPEEGIEDIEFNFLKEPFWQAYGKLGQLFNYTRDSLIDLKYLALMAIAASTVVFCFGLVIGGVADWAESESAAAFASNVVYTGLFIGSVGVVVIWLKVALTVLKAYYATKFGNAVFSKIPAIKKVEEADAFSAWAQTIAAWVGFGYLGAWVMQSYSPIWRHMGVFAFMLIIAIGMVEMNGWFEKKLGRPIAFGFQLAALVACLIWYFVPVIHDPVAQVASRYLGNSNFEMAKAKVERNRMAVLRERYGVLAEEQREIESRMNECDGRICRNDRSRYDQLQTELKALDDGTYMETIVQDQAKAKATVAERPKVAPAAPAPAKPKPEEAPKTEEQPVVEKEVTKPSKTAAYRVPARNDPVWKLLD
jgi:hypothetical protein